LSAAHTDEQVDREPREEQVEARPRDEPEPGDAADRARRVPNDLRGIAACTILAVAGPAPLLGEPAGAVGVRGGHPHTMQTSARLRTSVRSGYSSSGRATA
jgi:hypothetical protein